MALFSKKGKRGKRTKVEKPVKIKQEKIKKEKKPRGATAAAIKENVTFTKLKDGLVKAANFAGLKFEEIFNNSRFSAFATLGLAVILVFSMHSLDSIALIKQVNATIRDKNVVAQYDREKYVVEGLPDTVNVQLQGDDAAIQSTRTTNSLTVLADLTNLGAGDHMVTLSVDNLPSNVKGFALPGSAKVSIYTKEFRVFPISPEVINGNAISGVTIKNPVLVDNQVQLKGPAKDLDRVSFVRGLIDGKTINQSLTDRNATKFDGIGALVVAYDEQGNRIDNVATDSGGIDYTIGLEKAVGKPINDLSVELVGNFPEGQAVKTFALQTQTVTINGIASEIDKVSNLVVRFDMKNLSPTGTVEGRVVTPEGVTLTNIVPQRITANITFGPAETRQVEVSQVTRINSNDSRFDYAVVNNNQPIMVDVIGTREQLAQFDQMTQRKPLRLFVDVANLGEGEHQLGLLIEGPPLFRYKASQPTVKIRITTKQ